MFERAISPEEVRLAVDSGDVIAEYPDDAPLPSYLVSFVGGKRPPARRNR